MPAAPPYPEPFRTAVLGTVFGDRTSVVHRLQAGDRLILVPDPPGADIPAVWVHAPGGDVIGHLSLQIAVWLAPWMLAGGRAGAARHQPGRRPADLPGHVPARTPPVRGLIGPADAILVRCVPPPSRPPAHPPASSGSDPARRDVLKATFRTCGGLNVAFTR